MRRQRIGRGRSGSVANGFVWLAILLASLPFALAQAQPLVLTYDMPVRPHALSKADFDAIVAEAHEVAKLSGDTGDVSHWPAQWKSLDRAKLAALWSMPASATLDDSARIVLVEQAAQWDMLAFDRPSDAAILWEKLWPRRPGADRDAPPNSTGIALVADPLWSDNAVAMLGLFRCAPSIAWSAPGDPVVWATSHPAAWTSNWDSFRECIRENIAVLYYPDRDGPASIRRNEAVVALLKAKFTRELRQDGCRREGPDSCLLIYQFLYSLDRKNPQLVAVVRKMERSFDLHRPIAMPASARLAQATPGSTRSALPDADPTLLDAADVQAERRNLLLTLKLPLVLERPEAWPRGELDRTLAQAMETTLLFDRIRRTPGSPRSRAKHHRGPTRYFNDPWQWIDADAAPATSGTLRALGASFGGRAGCDQDGLSLGTRLPAFWQGWAMEIVRQGKDTCNAFGNLRLPEVYLAASRETDDAAAAREMAVFAPIATALAHDGTVRTQALDAMAETCATLKAPGARDPWTLCAGVAAREAEKAEIERKRLADEQANLAAIKASQPPPDPYACGDDVVMLAVKALRYKGDEDFWKAENTACRLQPDNPQQAIVALTYTHGDQLSGSLSDNNDRGYDFDLVVVRTDDGRLVARNAHGAGIDSDAITFEGIGIDTANYTLAPGVRAFGVRVEHDSHCYQCQYAQTDLTLYLKRGKRLDAILDTMVHQTRGEADATDCGDLPNETTRTLQVAHGTSHGLADLEVTTSTRSIADDDAPAACKTDAAASVVTSKLSFDGKKYPLPAGFDSP